MKVIFFVNEQNVCIIQGYSQDFRIGRPNIYTFGVNWVSISFSSHCIIYKKNMDLGSPKSAIRCPKDTRTPLWLKIKAWYHLHWHQCHITMSWLEYLSAGWLFLLKTQHESRTWTNKSNIKTPIGPFTLAKTKIQKTWVFCCTVYTARKTHNIWGFWHEKRMREKTRISYLCFGKWCACATSLYLWPYTCSAHYVAGRGRVIPLKVTCHVTKNPNNTGEIGASVYIGKKSVKFRRSFKKSRCGGGFFDSGFLECLGEVA